MSKTDLRDYQKACLEATVAARVEGTNKQLVVAGVGAGKTVMFSHLPHYHDDMLPMLVLAHREELLTQAATTIAKFNPGLKIETEMGDRFAADDADVVCASVATIGRNGSPRIERFEKNYFNSIIVDEAHHSAGTTYKNVFNYFTAKLRWGFTATPKRPDNVRLDDVFDKIVFEKSMLELINEGYLSTPISYRFSSSVDLSDVSISNGDYAIGELSQAVNVEARHEVCIEGYEKVKELIEREPSCIIFCVDVKHATDTADYFCSKGYKAKAVHGKSPDRTEILDGHKKGEFNILVNVGVLIEGYDDPMINCVIIARPTRSSVFYTQGVGRGARLDGLENTFYIIDVADATKGKRPLSILSLSGMPADFEANGEPLQEVVEKYQALKQKSASSAVTVKSLEDIDAAWEKIDIFTPPPPNEALLAYSQLLWMEVGDDFIINATDTVRVRITVNQLGQCGVYKNDEIISEHHSLIEAFSAADNMIRTKYQASIPLIDTKAEWRLNPPTEKQIKILKRYNVPFEHLSKGDASTIIDQLFKDNPRSAKQQWAIKNAQKNKSFNF